MTRYLSKIPPFSQEKIMSPSTLAPTPSLSPTETSIAPGKRRRARYAKAYGYLLDPAAINKQAIENGTAANDQFSRTFAAYRNKLCNHCGIKYEDIVSVRHPQPHMPPIYCIAAATNLSKHSREPDQFIIAKAKEFLKVTEEPKWYYIVRD